MLVLVLGLGHKTLLGPWHLVDENRLAVSLAMQCYVLLFQCTQHYMDLGIWSIVIVQPCRWPCNVTCLFLIFFSYI